MDEDLEARLRATEIALMAIISTLEQIPESGITQVLVAARARFSQRDPESTLTQRTLDWFDSRYA
ncbi:hypothetical protein C8K44_11582 [Aminobacter sp. AP02]|nr:hypothetical protein C8K44_11582 [Aminobacter sp. AP02]